MLLAPMLRSSAHADDVLQARDVCMVQADATPPPPKRPSRTGATTPITPITPIMPITPEEVSSCYLPPVHLYIF